MVGSIEGARSLTYQVLARKWRPQVFDAVVGQDPVTRTLRNALASGRVAHAYLFTGPRGVGKTTTARLLAKALACTARTGTEACGACPSCLDFASGAPVDVMEIDAASNTGVDDIRTLRENVKYSPARGRFKVYIVDEVHMLSGPAFNAFLKTLEEPPPPVVFILATTDPKKIPATVLSRCQRFDFKPISPESLTETLSRILTEEAVPAGPARAPAGCWAAPPRPACGPRSRSSTPRSPTARASSTRPASRACSAPPRRCTGAASCPRRWPVAAPRRRAAS